MFPKWMILSVIVSLNCFAGNPSAVIPAPPIAIQINPSAPPEPTEAVVAQATVAARYRWSATTNQCEELRPDGQNHLQFVDRDKCRDIEKPFYRYVEGNHQPAWCGEYNPLSEKFIKLVNHSLCREANDPIPGEDPSRLTAADSCCCIANGAGSMVLDSAACAFNTAQAGLCLVTCGTSALCEKNCAEGTIANDSPLCFPKSQLLYNCCANPDAADPFDPLDRDRLSDFCCNPVCFKPGHFTRETYKQWQEERNTKLQGECYWQEPAI